MKLVKYLDKQGKGSRAELARKLGVDKSMISHLCRGVLPSVVMARKIEKLTNGLVSKEDLRPDIWE